MSIEDKWVPITAYFKCAGSTLYLKQEKTISGRVITSIEGKTDGAHWIMSSYENLPTRGSSMPHLTQKTAMAIFNKCNQLLSKGNLI